MSREDRRDKLGFFQSITSQEYDINFQQNPLTKANPSKKAKKNHNLNNKHNRILKMGLC